MYLPLYPAPVKACETGEVLRLGKKNVLRVAEGDTTQERRQEMRALWRRFSSLSSEVEIVEDAALRAHTALLDSAEAELEAEDSYALKAAPSGVAMAGKDAVSLLHAYYTLLQLLQPLEDGTGSGIECIEVHDHPAMPMRAIHLCIFPETTLESVEKLIRMAALMKMTHIVMEFWGTLKLDCFPAGSWPDASFTKAEFEPMIRLARAMGLEIIPMNNHLGHATQSRAKCGRHVVLDQDPSKALLFEPDGWTWCLSNPEAGSLLRNVREEMMEYCGEGSYYHLGCDEAYSFASCPRCRKSDRVALLADYLNGIAKDLSRRGRRAIIWGDAMLDSTAWPRPYAATSRPDQKTHLALPKLDRSIVIADWHYGVTDPEMATSAYFKKEGFDVLTCPWDGRGNVEALTAAADRQKLLGTMLTTWNHTTAMMIIMNKLGGCAWCGEKYHENPAQRIHSAALLRRVMPVAGSFRRAGFMPVEYDISNFKTVYD